MPDIQVWLFFRVASASGMIRHCGTSRTPLRTFIGCWHGKTMPGSQSMKTGSVWPTTSLRVARVLTRGGVTATHSDGAAAVSATSTRTTSARSGASASGNRRLRQVGVSPMSIGNIRPSALTRPSASTRPNCIVTFWPACTTPMPSTASTDPATAIVSSGVSSERSGSRYQSEVSEPVPDGEP